MSRAQLLVSLFAFTLCMGQVAHGTEQAQGKAAAASPEAATKHFIVALKQRDQKAYDAAVVSSELAESLFVFAVAAERFKEKMLEAYGKVGWQNFQDSEGANIKLSYNDTRLDEIKYTIEGDAATSVLAEGGESLHLVRKEQRWYVDLERSFEADNGKGGMTAKSFGEALAKMAKIIRAYESRISDDTTVDQLDKEMGAEFLAVLLAAGAKPNVSVKVEPSDNKK